MCAFVARHLAWGIEASRCPPPHPRRITRKETDDETDSMRIPTLAVALLMLALTPVSAQGLESLFAGSEVRRSQMFGGDQIRFDVWKFSDDGTFAGVFSIEHSSTRSGGVEEGQTTGQWRIKGERLCVDAKIYGYNEQACFSLKQTGRTGSYVEFQGTEVGTDRRWMFYVAPGR